MLKAVRFDEEKHKHLIDWVEKYKDVKGKINESEGIRFLMQMGFEYCERQKEVHVAARPDPEPVQAVPEPKSDIDRDSLKRELMDEVMGEINAKMLGGLSNLVDKLSNLQLNPTVVQVPTLSAIQENQPVQQKAPEFPAPTKKKVRVVPVEDDDLLANILGNADR